MGVTTKTALLVFTCGCDLHSCARAQRVVVKKKRVVSAKGPSNDTFPFLFSTSVNLLYKVVEPL